MRKLSIIVFLMFSLMLSGMTQAASIDVTAPGDSIKGVPDDANSWPAAEAPQYVIDNKANTKYLNFRGATETTGFRVSASLGGMVVTEMTFTTGNDAPERDPIVFELYGSNDSIDGPYTLIAAGDILDFNLPDPWPRMTKNETPVTFANAVAYAHYQVLFPNLRVWENGCCMQISEVELLATLPDLTAPWVYKDIGTSSGGNAWEDAGKYLVRASGHDVWGNSDGFGYMYRPLLDDGSIEVKLTSMDLTDAWAKVGVMIRETSEPDSKVAFMAMTGSNGVQLVTRTSTGGGCTDITVAGQTVPEVLKLTRVGNEFTAEYGFELFPGHWEMNPVGTVVVSMNSEVLIGLAVCSHNNDLLCTGVFESMVSVIPAFYGPWDMAPADGSADMPLSPTLTWLPGETATDHDVYFGTDSAALPLVATKVLGDESYTPDTPLLEGTTYYWQIVEQPGDYAGPVYSFTTYAPPTGITREVWEGIGGTEVPAFTNNAAYPCCPTWSDKLPSMASYDFADNYGAHMQGLLWPETSGDYTFWIAADDGCELWLSSDSNPDNLVKIAEHVGWNNAHNWYDSPEQQSAPVTLVGGEKYWIRGIWKEGGGGDNCQVAWQGPDQPDAPAQGSPSAVITNYWFPLDSLELDWVNPADGTPLTLLEAEDGISWSPKRGATYDVYFGEEGSSMALIYSGPETSATPPVELDKTYNWKVDAVYDTGVVEGTVQSFTVQEWVSIDIGRENNPEPAGSSSFEDGIYTLHAGGDELWGQSDQFHYLYTTMKLTRDTGSIQARVRSIEHLGADWSRGGVQIRESRASNSRKVMAHKTAADNTRMQWREQTGWDTWNTADNYGLGFPLWVRLDRDHDNFNGYYSYDGENWNHLGGVWCPMEADKYVCIGLALCHHNGAPQDLLATGTFDNLTITTPEAGQAWSLSPSNGAENVPLYTTLSWNPGDDAYQHLVYFSDNRDDVYYGLVEPTILPLGTEELEVGPLDLGKVYYWCVDEVRREGHDIDVTLGEIVSFKVENYRLIEDFEPYDDPPVPIEPLPDQSIIGGDYIAVYAEEPNLDCLMAYWAFEGDFNDSSGNGFDGMAASEPNSNPAIVTDAERGLVLSLDGDQDYVNCGNPNDLNFSTGNWSLSAWVKNTMTGTGDINKGSIIANGGDGGGGHRYGLVVSEQTEGKTTLVTDDNVTKVQAQTSTSVNDDVWHHILGVREGNAIKIYVDGVLESTSGTPDPYDLSGTVQADVLIGAITLAADGTKYKTYAGLIDDVQIYGCALSEGNARYLAGVGDLYIPPIYGPMIAYYDFEGDMTDGSGNGFDGVAYGDAAVVEDAVRGFVATFDGAGDAINIGNDSMFNPGSEDFSISTWINMTSYGGDWGNAIIGKRGESGLSWQVRRLSNTARISFTTRGGGDEDGWGTGGQDVSLNEWHHVAAVRQGVQKWLYIDGIQEAISDAPTTIPSDEYDVYIGARSNGDNTGPEANFNGMVDEVRYFKNHALTWGEVLNLLEYDTTNSIHDTWSENGATLTLDYFSPHWGAKSMKGDFSSAGEVSRDPPFGDWSSGNARSMVLYAKGDPANAIDDMYLGIAVTGPIQLASTSFPYDGDISDLTSGDWLEWNIDTTGISGVREMTLGLVGTGTVNFDDIRLYPPRCRAEYGPLADFTGDCLVDTRDARVIALDWLERDYTLYAVEPDVAGLLAQYEFNDNYEDSSGNGNHGTPIGEGITIEDDPTMGKVLSLPGGDNIFVDCNDVGNSGNDPVTITCWAKCNHTSIPDWTLVFGFTGTETGEGGNGSHFNIGSIGGPGGVGAHVWGWEATIFTDEEALEWRHYAMAFDGTTIKYYGDSIQIGQVDFDLSIRADRVHIGSRITQASSLPGKVDDARVYNYQLSIEEIISAMGLTEVYYPIESPANLYDEEPANSRFINFKDYATLMEEWLYQQLWPN